MRVLSAEQIRQRLADRYLLLTTGSREAPSRQQTLRLCIDWSYDLCTDQKKLMWHQLCVFAGSFELDAAEDICEVPGTHNVLDLLTSLVDKSILIRDEYAGVVRFRLLETIRDYGKEKAQRSENYRGLRRRHADWFERLVAHAESDWISARQLEWTARLTREQPNLRDAPDDAPDDASGQALRIASTQFPFWLSRGLLNEGRYRLDRALRRRGDQPLADRVKALYADSVLAEIQGDLARGRELVDEAREIGGGGGDPVVSARIAHAAGLLALCSGDLPVAVVELEHAFSAFEACDDLTEQTWILVMLGLAYELQGDSSRAMDCHERVLALTESRGESVFRSYSL
ncbi:ATP-binding protein [Tomitella biformata]|uniref:ATP-binding protein n=1 Tax=Tomitella biformata TaxID=630403 RepID=UPI00046602F5|nr:hypothetical protein [Tomitella biformata]